MATLPNITNSSTPKTQSRVLVQGSMVRIIAFNPVNLNSEQCDITIRSYIDPQDTRPNPLPRIRFTLGYPV